MNSPRGALFSAFFACLALVFVARPAGAQVHWDASVHGGIAKRFFSSGSAGGGLEGSLGPVVGVQGDVALLPLLRLGAYADFEYASTAEPQAPLALSYGLRARVGPPFNYGNVHWYAFGGLGMALWNAPGYQQPLSASNSPSQTAVTVNVPSAGGYFFEIPLGLGAAWRFRKPWEIVFEVSGRIGFGSSGSYFDSSATGAPTRAATSPGAGTPYALNTGNDVFALLATLGIGLDE